MRRQLVQYLRTLRQLLIVLAVLVQQSDGLSVTALCIGIFLFFPIHITQCQQQHTFLHSAARSLLTSCFVGFYGVQGVFLRQIRVADGIVNLIQIVLVVVRCCHPFQLLDFTLMVHGGQHLRLGNARVELQFVGRVQSDNVLKSLVGLVFMSQDGLQLSHQEPLTGFLLPSAFVFDGLAQILRGLLVASAVYVIVGIRVVPVLHSPEVHRVALLLGNDVLSVV